jgi:hypothetical protein
VAAAEAALRLLRISYPIFLRDDYVLGTALRPGTEGWQIAEGHAYVRINSAGFRDSEHSQSKPRDTERIAVLGDSFAQAEQVPMHDAFWKVAERELSRCPALTGSKVEVLNFGVDGYGTAQELITLRRRVWDYHPDVVALAFTIDNDFTDNSRQLADGKIRPFFELRQGKLVLDDSFRNLPEWRRFTSWPHRWARRLSDHSRLLQLVFRVKLVISMRNDVREDADAGPYRAAADPVWRDTWRVTEALLAQMNREVKAHGADFLVMIIPGGDEVYPDRAFRQAVMKREGAADLLIANKELVAFGDREGIRVLDLAPSFQAYADLHHAFLHGFSNTKLGYGHWNSLGHLLAGRILAQTLCAKVLGRRPS